MTQLLVPMAFLLLYGILVIPHQNVWGLPTQHPTTQKLTRRQNPQGPIRRPLETSGRASQLTCPPVVAIDPCLCDSIDGEFYLNCVPTTQENINNLFTQVRNVNDLSLNDTLNITSVLILHSDLTQLDLSPLLYSRMDWLLISGNYKLNSITVNEPQSEDDTIDVLELSLPDNNLGDESLGDIFRHFLSNLKVIDFTRNSIIASGFNVSDGSGDKELFPGFSKFVNLEMLDLRGNNIQRIQGGLFKKFVQLKYLMLLENQISTVEDDAFIFDDPENGIIVESRIIALDNNLLAGAENLFSGNSGLEQLTDGVNEVTLMDNRLEYLSSEIYKEFLDVNGNNTIWARWNKFVCDERMRWLHDARDLYEHRVNGVECTNDWPNTIFTTTLLSL